MALRPTLLIDSLKKSDCFVVCFNESLNDVLQSCEIDLLLRYFDFDDFTVKICYCDSRFFGHATHQYLVKQCNDGMKQLDVNKLLPIFMDGSSVNHKFLEEVSKERKGNKQYQLINIGSYGLHTIHGAFKTGDENAKWIAKQTSKEHFKSYTILLQDEMILNLCLERKFIHSNFVPPGRYSFWSKKDNLCYMYLPTTGMANYIPYFTTVVTTMQQTY